MEKNDQILMQLIYMFHTSAMQGLGKIADPTGQVSRNLEYVSQTIDLMEMLKVKTRGNVTEDIEKLLDGMLSELRLNYIDEKAKPENKVEETKTEKNKTVWCQRQQRHTVSSILKKRRSSKSLIPTRAYLRTQFRTTCWDSTSRHS